ncbi:ComEC/Rec2 family competence protein [Negadavirga shengliensis]|uniref:ComEC/Rec2 family competence protein n=1 Tax=Negadavirga shengliensis TaxID=1389218 RepID=A0ABV9SZQ1_9BACT
MITARLKRINRVLWALLIIFHSPWSFSQTLEIHQMSVGHGDAALIIVRDTAKLHAEILAAGLTVPPDRTEMLKLALDKSVPLAGTVLKAVLVDGGDGSKQAAKINAYITKTGIKTVDYVIASHYHQDHIGGLPAVIATNPSANGTKDRGDTKSVPPKGTAKKRTVYGKYVDAATKAPMTRNTAGLGSTVDLIGTANTMVQLLVVATNNYVLGEDSSQNPPRNGSNQNDLGLAWILQYGNFRFYTGGDLGGWKTGGYIDMESPLADSIKRRDKSNFKWISGGRDVSKGHICSFKASHHGSTLSTSEYFLSQITPVVGIVSCGDKHGHPNEEVIEAMEPSLSPRWDISSWTAVTNDTVANTFQKYYLTSLMDGFTDNTRRNVGNPTHSVGIIGGDIVLVVNDEDIATKSRFSVFWNGELPGTMVSSVMRAPNAASIVKHECHEVKTNQSDLVYLK